MDLNRRPLFLNIPEYNLHQKNNCNRFIIQIDRQSENLITLGYFQNAIEII